MIKFNEKNKIFAIETKNCGYYIGICDEENFLGHIHFGEKLSLEDDLKYKLRIDEHPFLPSSNNRDRLAFNDSFPWEYPCGGLGDYSESCLEILNEKGQNACSLEYFSHDIISEKKSLVGLPSLFSGTAKAESLIIHCRDKILNLEVDLIYSIFDDSDAIIRSVKIKNQGNQNLKIKKALSACIQMDNQNFDFISLHGAWGRERHIEKTPLLHGKLSVSSSRGITSPQRNNFFALSEKNANYDFGNVYGFSLIYSGNFLSQAEINQFDMVRSVVGINPQDFLWNLNPGSEFICPEVALVYSNEGLNRMSNIYHDLWRNHLIRSPYQNKLRPVLINNWEGTYFNFNTAKLISMAKKAKSCGIELFVMDDGWFACRNNDECSLGDWTVNETKLPGGLKYLADEINKLGMKFGIWMEPEMVSRDSELFRNHPDWAIQVEGRELVLSRAQCVLDITREEVFNYVYECISKVLKSANIEYLKWDMNRPLSDLGSLKYNGDASGELFHRYVLALYVLQEKLVKDFPYLLFENCSSGGARFDPGMLYYSPQIWCSDDCDPIERLSIHQGSALVYPLSTFGSHVAASPNHTVLRETPFWTRSYVALTGTFGYELDVENLSSEELEDIPKQIDLYKKINHLIRQGDYFRLASYCENHKWDAWQVVSKDKKELIVNYVQVLNEALYHSRILKLKSLNEEFFYNVDLYDWDGKFKFLGKVSGKTLMNGGLKLNRLPGDFKAQLFYIHLEN